MAGSAVISIDWTQIWLTDVWLPLVLVLILAVFRIFLKRDVWMLRAAALAGAMVVGQRCLSRKAWRPVRVLQMGVWGLKCLTSSLSHYIFTEVYSNTYFKLLFPLLSHQIKNQQCFCYCRSSQAMSPVTQLSEERGQVQTWLQCSSSKDQGLSLTTAPERRGGGPREVPHSFLSHCSQQADCK